LFVFKSIFFSPLNITLYHQTIFNQHQNTAHQLWLEL